MLRDISQPLDFRRLAPDVRIETTGNRPVDDNLLLLVQQRNNLPLGLDGPIDASVDVIEEAHDGGLFVGRRE